MGHFLEYAMSWNYSLDLLGLRGELSAINKVWLRFLFAL